MDENKKQAVREFVADEVLFASEAADYLGISTQRLNQLVHSGKLEPVRISRAGSLFLKTDLEERRKEVEASKKEIELKAPSLHFCNSKIVQEAMSYCTIQTALNASDKKTLPVFKEIRTRFDVTEPIINYIEDIGKAIDVDTETLLKAYDKTLKGFAELKPTDIIIKRGQDLYPELLDRTEEAPPYLFLRGNVQLLQENALAIVGTRNPSPEGEKRASVLASLLGKYRIVVASGLAKGIDTAAHLGALNGNNYTIAVIGTPITKVYPKENAKLQQRIEEEGLVISQFAPGSEVQRWNFPMRNAIMSGISLATVIIEAGETSGALIQANYALKQGRFVFIPQSALQNPSLKWPQKYIQQKGAESFGRIDELISKLELSKVIEKHETSKPIDLFESEAGIAYVHRSE